MPYTRKTYDEFELKADYGYGNGFECICTEETRREAMSQRKTYRENWDFAPMRIVKKRVKIETQEVKES